VSLQAIRVIFGFYVKNLARSTCTCRSFTVRLYRPDSALAKVALKPEDITDIILTHPRWDHIDGITLFPNAHIWMQKDDYGYFAGAALQI
jgi:phosphoribosyl 1,2-cyclic phosphodiesterase